MAADPCSILSPWLSVIIFSQQWAASLLWRVCWCSLQQELVGLGKMFITSSLHCCMRLRVSLFDYTFSKKKKKGLIDQLDGLTFLLSFNPYHYSIASFSIIKAFKWFSVKNSFWTSGSATWPPNSPALSQGLCYTRIHLVTFTFSKSSE